MVDQVADSIQAAEGGEDAKERDALLNEIRSRKIFDVRWAETSFRTYQVQGWLLVSASFGSAIGAAAKLPYTSIAVAILAAIPGAVFVIDQRLNFARRAQWHWMMETRLLELEHALVYQGAKISDVSKRYVELRKEMETKFPIVPEDWLERIKPKPGEIPTSAPPPSDHSREPMG